MYPQKQNCKTTSHFKISQRLNGFCTCLPDIRRQHSSKENLVDKILVTQITIDDMW